MRRKHKYHRDQNREAQAIQEHIEMDNNKLDSNEQPEALLLPDSTGLRICKCNALVLGVNACPRCGRGWAEVLVPMARYVREGRASVAVGEGEALADVIALLRSFEFNGNVPNVSEGHCPECWNFPDRSTTAQAWRDRDRVGHKLGCGRGARFKAAYEALDALSAHDTEIREVLGRFPWRNTSEGMCWCWSSPNESHAAFCLAARKLYQKVQAVKEGE